MKHIAASCQNQCRRLQAIIRVFLGRVKFVNLLHQPLSGVLVPEDGMKLDGGIGDGLPIASPWLDISDLTDEEVERAVAEFVGLSVDFPGKVRGLGDVIAMMTTAVGIKPCGGCKKRQAALNRMVPAAAVKNALAYLKKTDKV